MANEPSKPAADIGMCPVDPHAPPVTVADMRKFAGLPPEEKPIKSGFNLSEKFSEAMADPGKFLQNLLKPEPKPAAPAPTHLANNGP